MERPNGRPAGTATPAGPTEADEEQLRDRYREALEEYRTILPGVQILLGFLLTVPFSQRFEQLDDLGRDLFMVAIVSTALAILLFLMPTAFHRGAPDADRKHRVQLAVRATLAGMLAVAISVVTAIFVVTRFVYDDTVTAHPTTPARTPPGSRLPAPDIATRSTSVIAMVQLPVFGGRMLVGGPGPV